MFSRKPFISFFSQVLRHSSSSKPLNLKFLQSSFSQIESYLKSLSNPHTMKVVDFKTPDQLSQIIDFSIPETTGLSDDDLLVLTQKIIDFSVHPGHNHFFNTLFQAGDEYSLVGEYLTSSLNGTMYSYEMAPVFNLMEKAVFQKHANAINWTQYEGLFAPGGSMSNLYGLILARHHKFPEVKRIGMKKLPDMAIFTSELSHYSIEKAAIIIGLGLDNVYKIETDNKGKIIPEALENAIIDAKANGKVPLLVNATLGTTVFGALDPFNEIAKICKKYDIWLHIDGSFAWSLVFLDEMKGILEGISQADSVVFNPHKVLSIPLQCSMFLTKHVSLLKKCNSTNADYLFMNDKLIYDARCLDFGDASIQCGRHIDVLKYWLFLKAHGFNKMLEMIRNALNNAKYLAELVKNHKNFQLILEPEFLAVNFFYFSDRLLKQYEKDGETEEFWQEVSRLPPIIKAEMVKKGSMMIAYQKQKQKNRLLNNFFRPIITVNKTRKDMEFIVEEIHRIGQHL